MENLLHSLLHILKNTTEWLLSTLETIYTRSWVPGPPCLDSGHRLESLRGVGLQIMNSQSTFAPWNPFWLCCSAKLLIYSWSLRLTGRANFLEVKLFFSHFLNHLFIWKWQHHGGRAFNIQKIMNKIEQIITSFKNIEIRIKYYSLTHCKRADVVTQSRQQRSSRHFPNVRKSLPFLIVLWDLKTGSATYYPSTTLKSLFLWTGPDHCNMVFFAARNSFKAFKLIYLLQLKPLISFTMECYWFGRSQYRGTKWGQCGAVWSNFVLLFLCGNTFI